MGKVQCDVGFFRCVEAFSGSGKDWAYLEKTSIKKLKTASTERAFKLKILPKIV